MTTVPWKSLQPRTTFRLWNPCKFHSYQRSCFPSSSALTMTLESRFTDCSPSTNLDTLSAFVDICSGTPFPQPCSKSHFSLLRGPLPPAGTHDSHSKTSTCVVFSGRPLHFPVEGWWLPAVSPAHAQPILWILWLIHQEELEAHRLDEHPGPVKARLPRSVSVTCTLGHRGQINAPLWPQRLYKPSGRHTATS